MTNSLLSTPKGPNSKYLVFTSAGDKSNLHHWLKGERNFDLWISYYGDKENNYLDLSDYYIARKGGKFPNFYYIHQKWGDILNNYQAIIFSQEPHLLFGNLLRRGQSRSAVLPQVR